MNYVNYAIARGVVDIVCYRIFVVNNFEFWNN